MKEIISRNLRNKNLNSWAATFISSRFVWEAPLLEAVSASCMFWCLKLLPPLVFLLTELSNATKPRLPFIGLILLIGVASHELSFSSPSFSQISPGANSSPVPGHPNKVICERVRLQSLFPLLPSDQNTTLQEDAHFKAFFQVLICLPFPYTGLEVTHSS